MSLSDLLAGRWIPAPAPESDTSLPADAPSLSALLRQPGLGAADLLRSLAAPPSAAVLPQDPPRDSFSSMLDPRLSYGGVPGSIARDLRQAGYSSPSPFAQGGESDPGSYVQPASYAGPASYPGRQYPAGTQQTPDYGGQGYGNPFDPTPASASTPSPDLYGRASDPPLDPAASTVPDDSAYGSVADTKAAYQGTTPVAERQDENDGGSPADFLMRLGYELPSASKQFNANSSSLVSQISNVNSNY
jgi:hypothetical protein